MTLIDRRYSVAEGTAVKAPCAAATTANITLSGAQTIDGIAVTDASPPTRVLVKNQSNAVLNGIYDVSTGNWTRSRDFDGAFDIVTGTRVYVTGGAVNATFEYVVSTTGTIIIDTTAITFAATGAASAAASAVAAASSASSASSSAATAVAAAISASILSAATRTVLKAADTTVTKAAILRESGREGEFVWQTGNYASLVTADPQEGIYIKANAIATSAGAWVRVRKEGEYNVKWFGALGDNATNDYTAIQAAINLCGTNAGGDVLFPKGGYVINTGLTVSVALTRLVGVGKRYCSIVSGVGTITLITISAARCAVTNLSIFQLLVPSVTTYLVNMASGAVQCTISDLDMVGGSFCFGGQSGSTDVVISDCVMRLAFSGANVYTLGAGAYVFDRCVLNQDWPVATPAASNSKGARANTTGYSLNDYVTLSGYFLQCSQAGTSGGSPPSLAAIWYGTQITDGTVKWYIAGNATGAAAVVDSASTYITFKDCDFTGAYAYGARVINNLGTTDPDVIRFNDCTTAGITLHGIHLVAAKSVWVERCEIQANIGTSGTRSGIYVDSSIAGDLVIRGNRVTSGFASGITLGNTSLGSAILEGNMAFGLAAGVSVVANVNNFVIVGNNFGSSANFGNNTTGVLIAAGTSDNYVVSGNRLFGATTKISDLGTGLNKSVTGNV